MENKLGDFLKEKRGTMSLRDFASKLDISHTYLDSLEKGYDSRNKKPVRITVDTLSKIAKALNEPLEKLVCLSENKEYNLKQSDIPEIRQIERGAINMSQKDREKMVNMIKLAFEEAFNEDSSKQ